MGNQIWKFAGTVTLHDCLNCHREKRQIVKILWTFLHLGECGPRARKSLHRTWGYHQIQRTPSVETVLGIRYGLMLFHALKLTEIYVYLHRITDSPGIPCKTRPTSYGHALVHVRTPNRLRCRRWWVSVEPVCAPVHSLRGTTDLQIGAQEDEDTSGNTHTGGMSCRGGINHSQEWEISTGRQRGSTLTRSAFWCLCVLNPCRDASIERFSRAIVVLL